MPRPRKYTSDPGRWPACVRCGDGYPKPTRWPEGLVCRYCVRAARTRQGTCAHCGHQGILPGVAPDGRFLCAQCSDVPLDVHCKRCGDETMTTDQAICWRCLLAVRVSTLLAGPDGAIPEPLQPLAQAIINMPRPKSAERELLSVSWLRLGKERWSRVGGGPQASGRANKPGSVSTRMPRLARRFSLERMPSVFFGRIGRSRAWQRSRARIGRPASVRAVRICW